MLVDASLPHRITETKAKAKTLEGAGYDGIWLGETKHEPFLQMLHAADATNRVTLGTGVAIAFARSPMTLANAAYDLAVYSSGRFVLGLGTQIKPHITKRFSMPWSHPAPRMREMVQAIKAIWAAWDTGETLAFRGEFYTHTLMTPFFRPDCHEFGAPPIYLAGVGELMTEVAGEVCEGFIYHPFTTERYVREVTTPALLRGRAKSGHADLDGFAISGPAFICTGRDDQEMAVAVAGTKAQIAFYASTPAYKGVLDLHGWGDVRAELGRLIKADRWADLGDVIDDEMLHTFAVVGGPSEAGAALTARWGEIATRITLYATYAADPAIWPEVIAAIRAN